MNRVGRNFENKMADLGRRFRDGLETMMPISVVYANVVSVDRDALTMDVVMNDEKTVVGISLDVVTNGNNSVLLIPTEGSDVIIGFVEGMPELSVVLKFSRVDEIVISNDQAVKESHITLNGDEISVQRGGAVCTIKDNDLYLKSGGGASAHIADDTITLNGGEKGDMVQIGRLTERLNKMQEEINAFVSRYNEHTHNYSWTSAAGSAITTATTAKATDASGFSDSEYNNEKVKQ